MTETQILAAATDHLRTFGIIKPSEFMETYAIGWDRTRKALHTLYRQGFAKYAGHYDIYNSKGFVASYRIFAATEKLCPAPKSVVDMRYADEECARYSRLVMNRFAY